MGKAVVLRGWFWQHDLDGPGHKHKALLLNTVFNFAIFVSRVEG